MASEHQRKHALLIGLNSYLNFPDLKGCIHDIELMAKVLRENFAFPSEAIHQLRDEEATRDAILAAFDDLTDRVEEDDVVVVHYSGHGSQKRDVHGDEPDRYDETIVPYDSGRKPHSNLDIVDDEIYVWLLELTGKTKNVTLVFDSCNAATIVRDAFGAPVRRVPRDESEPDADSQLVSVPRGDGPSGWLPVSDRYVLIAACREDESACELHEGDVSHGALTHFLCQELAISQPGTTYRDVFERMVPNVTRHFPNQHPQLEGTRDRALFGVKDIQQMRFVPVTERLGTKLVLGAGAAHGMRRGSRWAIYPSGTKQLENAPTPLGLAEITKVGAVATHARIVEDTQLISPGARAIEEAHDYGEMRLVVELAVPGGAPQALLDRLAESALLRVAESGERGMVRVYLVPPRDRATTSDPVPQFGALNRPMWVVVGEGGGPLMPAVPADDRDTLARLVTNLEIRARFDAAFKLKNADGESVLHDQVELTILCQRDGEFVPAEPEAAGGEIHFRPGQRLALRIRNNYERPIFVTVLDFGLSGRISQLYPVIGSREALTPGHDFEIGTRRGQELEIYFPENFPFAPCAARSGTEHLKLFATTAETDFTPLVQGQFRKASGQNPLGQLLTLALTGRGTRELRQVRSLLDEDWTTVTRSFVLRE